MRLSQAAGSAKQVCCDFRSCLLSIYDELEERGGRLQAHEIDMAMALDLNKAATSAPLPK